MNENECSNFLKLHRTEIDFPVLVSKAKEIVKDRLAAGDEVGAEKIAGIIGDCTLLSAVQQLPPDSIMSTFNI